MNILPEGSLSVRELKAAEELLNQFFEEVKPGESMLSGGAKLGLGGEALQQLKDTRISFGNPYYLLTRLTEEKFSGPGSEVEGFQKQMLNRFDFKIA